MNFLMVFDFTQFWLDGRPGNEYFWISHKISGLLTPLTPLDLYPQCLLKIKSETDWSNVRALANWNKGPVTAGPLQQILGRQDSHNSAAGAAALLLKPPRSISQNLGQTAILLLVAAQAVDFSTIQFFRCY